MKTKIIKNRAIYSLSALFVGAIMFIIVLTTSTLSVSADTNSRVLFDGTIAKATIPVADTNVDGVKVNIVGMNGIQDITDGFTLDGVTYYSAIKTGGSSNDTRYISFTVPETIGQFVVKVVVAPNGSTKVNIGLSTQISKVPDNEAFFTTDEGQSSSTYKSGMSAIQTATQETTYYLNFSASARIAYVAIAPADGQTVEPSLTDSSTTDSSTSTDSSTITDTSILNSGSTTNSSVVEKGDLSSYSGTSNDKNSGDTATNKRDTIVLVQMLLGVLLAGLIVVGIVSLVSNHKKKNDYFDYEDFDDFDDWDE